MTYLHKIQEEFLDLYYKEVLSSRSDNYSSYLYINSDLLVKILDETISSVSNYIGKIKNIESFRDFKALYLPVIGKINIIIDDKQDLYKIKIKIDD